MSDVTRVGRLEIDQNLRAQNNDWRAQRVGWGIMVSLVIAGALGVFGRGPLSHATARSPRGDVSLEYERFARLGAPLKLKVTLASGSLPSPVRLSISRQYLDRMMIERILPRPVRVRARGEMLDYAFELAGGRASRAEVVFEMQPSQAGVNHGTLGVGGQVLTFRQLVYP
ncbi:MAG: hypothetical protein H0W67_05380 [Gemmatimonadales bacterium]|nr:hypothetical protein [Gemmatimonadales bacterium]